MFRISIRGTLELSLGVFFGGLRPPPGYLCCEWFQWQLCECAGGLYRMTSSICFLANLYFVPCVFVQYLFLNLPYGFLCKSGASNWYTKIVRTARQQVTDFIFFAVTPLNFAIPISSPKLRSSWNTWWAPKTSTMCPNTRAFECFLTSFLKLWRACQYWWTPSWVLDELARELE